jgi:hypothetical protein
MRIIQREERMEHTNTQPEFDRRSVLLLGATGAATLLGASRLAVADDVKVEKLAPGVTLKTFKEVVPVGPIPGFSKARLMELTFEPGSKLGPEKLKNVDLCEIQGAPLYVEIEGKEPFTLQPGDFYACPVGQTETDTNKSDKPCIMRVMELEPA